LKWPSFQYIRLSYAYSEIKIEKITSYNLHLVDSSPEEPDFLFVEGCRLWADETETAGPDPEVDSFSLADVT
jgi:hypothetical protein